MTSHRPTVTVLPDAARCGATGPPLDVRSWRRCRLEEAGFPPDLAERVAGEGGYDLHALLELVDRGCPPGLAARILAPLPAELRS